MEILRDAGVRFYCFVIRYVKSISRHSLRTELIKLSVY